MIWNLGLPPLTLAVFIISASLLFLADLLNHRRGITIPLKSAAIWSVVYILGALAFAGFLKFEHGNEYASLFLTGYALEKVLAFDNLFVFSVVFTYFRIPPGEQHAALHWGIIGAIVFRLIFVALGVGSMHLIGPAVELLFALLILMSIVAIVKAGDEEEADYDKKWYVKYLKHRYPMITPFVLSIAAIEVSDIMFSFDSVPAVIAVTKEPLLIYSAMIFAILGLRSLYFVIAALQAMLVYMEQAIICVLAFIAGKLIINATVGYQVDPNLSLVIVLSIIVGGILLSLLKGKEKEA